MEHEEITPEMIEEVAVRDALHEGHPEDFTSAEILQLVEQLPAPDERHPEGARLHRLQAIWETEIDPLPESPEKEQLKDAYDKKAQELFASEIINLPEKEEAPAVNPLYDPKERLRAIGVALRAFPFARAAAMEKMYEVFDSKANSMGIPSLQDYRGNEL